MGMMYRYSETLYTGNQLGLYLQSFPVTKTTPCGVWIDLYGYPRFILLSARKRYACPTPEEALDSYRARKARQVKILTRKLEIAVAASKLQPNNELVRFGGF